MSSSRDKLIAIAIAIAAMAFGCSLGAAAKDFEGRAEISVESDASTALSTAYIKGLRVKLLPKQEIKVENLGEGYPVIDFEAKKLTLVSPKDKYYSEMSIDQFMKNIDAKAAKVRKGGKADAILGLPVEEWLQDEDSGGMRIVIRATPVYSLQSNLFLSMQKLYPAEGLLLGRAAKAVIERGLMPLEATVFDSSGKARLVWRVLELAEKSLGDGEFAIPAGYGKMSDVLKKRRQGGGH
jgi:hypothetical protein